MQFIQNWCEQEILARAVFSMQIEHFIIYFFWPFVGLIFFSILKYYKFLLLDSLIKMPKIPTISDLQLLPYCKKLRQNPPSISLALKIEFSPFLNFIKLP